MFIFEGPLSRSIWARPGCFAPWDFVRPSSLAFGFGREELAEFHRAYAWQEGYQPPMLAGA
jgi:hypothetical protein